MKIILTAVNAKYIHSNLAVYTLQASAEKAGVFPEIREFTINQSKDSMLRSLFLARADVVCVSCYIWNISIVEDLITEYHKISPKTKIWLGGPEVSYDSGRILSQEPEIRGIMRGEGELTFSQVAEAYLAAEDRLAAEDPEDRLLARLEGILGITYRDGSGEIRENGPQRLLSIDEIPFYYKDMAGFENRIVYYESSRGCPFSCSYCLSSIDKSVRFRSLSLVKKELDFFLERKVPQVKFVDRTFNCRREHTLGIWKHILDHDNGVTNFHFEVSADLFDQEELEMIGRMRPGLIQLEIGVQTTNPDTITEIRRKMNLDRLKQVVDKINGFRNIHQHLDLIAGLPYENLESFKKSFNDVYRLRPQQFQLGFLKVLKGSKMHEKAGEYGIVYHTRPMYEVLSTNWLTYDEVIYLKGIEEMVEVYYNSCQFRCTMRALEAEFDTPFAMYEALAEYYEENALNGLKHSRMGRFDILHDFILSYVKKEHAPKYEDDLLMDLYLREKSKSRPSWAADLSGYKSEIQEFFRKEAEEKRYLKDYEGYSWKQILNMTHVEVDSKGKWTLFDYKRRDPLTKDAKTYRILERKEEERV